MNFSWRDKCRGFDIDCIFEVLTIKFILLTINCKLLTINLFLLTMKFLPVILLTLIELN